MVIGKGVTRLLAAVEVVVNQAVVSQAVEDTVDCKC